MFEKVNPAHPDKIADRIAGAIVDIAYCTLDNPKIAVEVLIGHGHCYIIAETNVKLEIDEILDAVERISNIKSLNTEITIVPQDQHLSNNQHCKIRCGDNGIFKGVPVTDEQEELKKIAKCIYEQYKTDGKYILTDKLLTVCQSFADSDDIVELCSPYLGSRQIHTNPLGKWTGGVNVDSGATNRKLGSDMGDAITGGGLHGKDLSKADVSINVYCHMIAQITGKVIETSCAIGDEYLYIEGLGTISFKDIVNQAGLYIQYNFGGFEGLAEWGLI